MELKISFFAVLSISALVTDVFAATNVCSSGIYAVLAPLSNYAPAQSFCSAHVPRQTVTATKKKRWLNARATSTVSAVANARQSTTTSSHTSTTSSRTTTTSSRTTSTTSRTTTTSSHTTTTSSHTTTTTGDAKASLLSSLESQVDSIVTTFCQCIQPPVTVTVCISESGLREQVLTLIVNYNQDGEPTLGFCSFQIDLEADSIDDNHNWPSSDYDGKHMFQFSLSRT